MDWLNSKKEPSPPKEVYQRLKVYLVTQEPSYGLQFYKLLKSYKLKWADLCAQIIESAMLQTQFRESIKMFVMSESQEEIQRAIQNSKKCEKTQIQIIEKLRDKMISLRQAQKIYKKVKDVLPILKNIAIKKSYDEKEIHRILSNKSDEFLECKRLCQEIKELYSNLSPINESSMSNYYISQRYQEKQKLGNESQEVKQLRVTVQLYKKQLKSLKDNIEQNNRKILEKNQRANNVDYSQKFDIDEQSLNSVDQENQVFQIQSTLNIVQSINHIYKLLNNQEKLKKELQKSMNNLNNKLYQQKLAIKQKLKEQRHTEDAELKQVLKKRREQEHEQIMKQLKTKRDLDNSRQVNRLEQIRVNEDQILRSQLEAQSIKEITEKMSLLEANEKQKKQIQLHGWYNTTKDKLESQFKQQSDKIIKKAQEDRDKQLEKINSQLNDQKISCLKALQYEMQQKKRVQFANLQILLSQKLKHAQLEAIKKHQQLSHQLEEQRTREYIKKMEQQQVALNNHYQVQLKRSKQKIQEEKDKVRKQINQFRQREFGKINQQIDAKRKIQETNFQLLKLKIDVQLQNQKQLKQKFIQNELQRYRNSQDLRILEKLRSERQKIDQQQKQKLQQRRRQQDTKIRENLARERKQEDKKLRQQLQISRERINQDCSKFFSHNILRKYLHHKEFLVNTISERYRSDIEYTELLFTLDPKNKTNFHQYIDNKQNILVVIELQNGYFIAAFTQSPFKPKTKGTDAFIACLTTSMVYDIRAGEKAISYDDYYLIFGNSEIRLKSGEKMLFSNFGIGNSSFNHKGHNINHLLGEGRTNQVPLKSYQIYQIFFE